MVQEPTSYIHLGIDVLLKNERSEDSTYLTPLNIRAPLIFAHPRPREN
jgi:hypothetical protein